MATTPNLLVITSQAWSFPRPYHPESAERFACLGACTETYPWESLDAEEDDILDLTASIHSSSMIGKIRQASLKPCHLDPDTPTSPETWRAALIAQQAARLAVEKCASGEALRLFLPTRPPGHHATPKRPMGFCLFNHAALAADLAATRHDLAPVLVVDWDVHHGNGTQDIFYFRDDVFYFSMHQFPHYPGTGRPDETGHGSGKDWTRNLVFNPMNTRAEIVERFSETLQSIAERIRPKLIVISAGFDAHRADPLAQLPLDTEDFAEMTRQVVAVADHHAKGRVISLLEGGYDLEALRDSVSEHLRALAAPPAAPASD